MQTFDQALFDLYDEGSIGYDEALRNADSMNELRLQIKLKSQRGENGAPVQMAGLSLMQEQKKEEAEAPTETPEQSA